MLSISIDIPKIIENFRIINCLCQRQGMSLVVVTKLCLSDIKIIRPLIQAGMETIAETNVSSIAGVPDFIKKMLLRASLNDIRSGLDGFDYVLVSELPMIESLALSEGYARKGIFISVEAGDLREGVGLDELVSFTAKALKIKGVQLQGIAANFGCLRGMLPNTSIIQAIHEAAHQVKQRLNFEFQDISVGGTVIIDLLKNGELTGLVNQIRMGEAIFLGYNMSLQQVIPELHQDTLRFFAEIIEIREKFVPDDENLQFNAFGRRTILSKKGKRKRAVLNFGELMAPTGSLTPLLPGAEFAGATHEHAVLDITQVQTPLYVGDQVGFLMNYNSAAQAFMSPYITKQYISMELMEKAGICSQRRF